ncbi:MAG: ROK family protein [Planctomycetes bacterium]|nr:ROK family protein [Planctomycetota bacterium]MCB9935161.1 ROK family protein [Planctomycetota bacterium]
MPIGIDWGGTSIKAAIVDGAAVRGFARVETGGEPAAILDAIAGLVRVLDPRAESIGVAIPGEVRPDGRCWRLPNVPGFEDVNIAAELHARLGLPIGVENDATAAALAERLYGWGNQYGSFLLVTLGTGIGGGLVLDGHVRRGTNGFAGEIGHVLVECGEQAWTCGCGKRGCMEAYAGTAGLLRRYAESGKQAGSIKEIADADDAGTQAVWQQLGWALGTGLGVINNVLDLDAIVFTGGVANSLSRFETLIRNAMHARAFAPPLAQLPLLTSRLGEHAGVIGAAHLPAGMIGSAG